MMSDLHSAAEFWRAAGFGPFGTRPGEKRPIGTWKRYQDAPAPDDDVASQLRSGSHLGVVLLLGQECADVEGRAVESIWGDVQARAAEQGLYDLLLRVLDGYHERTPSGGLHLFWRCEHVEGNQKLASRPGPDGNPQVLIETRGRGGFVVVAPSPGYQREAGQPATIITITPDERDDLLALFRSFDQMPERERFVDPKQSSSRPGDEFNQRASWDDILKPAGWTHVGNGSRGEGLWKRPGNTTSLWSATTNATGRDTLIVHSTSTPFDTSPSSYSKFAAYALLNHNGDHKAAADDLHGRGFGQQSAPTGEGVPVEDAPARLIRLTPASTIKPRPVRWCWQDRIPIGEITVTAGRGDVGKSTFHGWLIARVTTGTLSGVYFGQPRACAIAATEDSWAHTIVPRLIVAGANLDLVYRVDVVTSEDDERTLTLPADIDALTWALHDKGVVLLSNDPLMSSVSTTLDTHKDREMRQVLEPLKRLADQIGGVVLANTHFTKGRDADIMRLIMGSGAFGNVPRAALGFVKDDESDDDSRVISQAKNNLGRTDLPSLKYGIVSTELQTDYGLADVGKLVMTGESERTASEILASASDQGDETKLGEAKEWVREFLTAQNAGEATSKQLLVAARENGITEKTLYRARQKVAAKRKDGRGGWFWSVDPYLLKQDGQDGQG